MSSQNGAQEQMQDGEKPHQDGEKADEDDYVSTDESDTEDSKQTSPAAEPPVFQMGGHRAGFDAFMTGMAFAFFIAKYGSFEDIDADMSLIEFGMEDYVNKVALSSKDIPLQIMKSAFSKTSREHKEKIQRLRDPQRTDMIQK